MKPVSQNGWPVHTDSSDLIPLRWVTGRVDERVRDLFDEFCGRFDSDVEKIVRSHSWGWAYRPIRGGGALSNHASGTAIDLNAPEHPMGSVGTFTDKQVKSIRSILKDFPELRWGGDYDGRKDEMHFEINVPVGRFEMSGMISPAEGRLTSTYGPRKPIPGVTNVKFHAGDDIANVEGTPIFAAFAGTVRRAGWGKVEYRSGLGLVIGNPDGEGQYYGHMSRIDVKVGQRVKQGQKIGEMGSTGNVTGPHLHFEAWHSWRKPSSHFDPMILFRKYGLKPGDKPKVADGGTKPAKPSKPSKKDPKFDQAVYNIQTVLIGFGDYKGEHDGVEGSMYRSAVKKYQRRQNKYGNAGLVIDGHWGSVTQDWFEWVKSLQRALPAWKGVSKVAVDGDYGKGTAAAVKTLQSRNGLVADGVAGAKTVDFMRKHGSDVGLRPSNRP